MPRFIPLLLLVLLLAACSEPAATPEAPASTDETVLFPVSRGGQWGFIDAAGTEVIPLQFEGAWPFSEGRALVKQNGQFGYIDTGGTIVVEPQFTDAWYFSEGLAPVEIDGRWGFIDPNGEIAVDPQFEIAPGLLEDDPYEPPNLGLVREGDRYGYTEDGSVVIEPRYEQAWYFAEGLARVRIGGKWGYIDRTGQTVIEPRFDQAWDFDDGLALVTLGGEHGYIDTTGSFVWGPAR